MKNNIEARFTPYATCEDLVNIYEKKLKGNEENIDVLTRITRVLNRKNVPKMKCSLRQQKTTQNTTNCILGIFNGIYVI